MNKRTLTKTIEITSPRCIFACLRGVTFACVLPGCVTTAARDSEPKDLAILLSETYEGWIKDVLSQDGHVRDGKWSQSIAVGTKSFVEKIKETLGIRAIGRQVVKTGDVCELKEPVSSYRSDFDTKKEPLSAKNSFSWRGFPFPRLLACIFPDT